ncbi:MAG: carbonate dehydratase [Parachlamydiales bacterium]|nr:carbonate dehydratase [Parachlamydiales bacterium]
MKELKKLFDNNRAWIAQKCEKDPSFFQNLSESQEPKYLWIGCSDSRVPANEIVGLGAGELFVHRNIGNLFLHTDINCLSVLEYAIDFLKIKHVILCGHYGCGGIQAAMEEQKQGVVDHWLRCVRDVYARNKEDLEAIKDLNKRSDRLVELNVKQQVLNICHTPIVQGAWARKQSLWVHGWVYDMQTGVLKDMDLCFSSINHVENIYRIN